MLVRAFALLYALALLGVCANLDKFQDLVDPRVIMVVVATQIPVIMSLYCLDLKLSVRGL